MTVALTDAQRTLLEDPIYGALGTVRPDGTVQVNPMWFEFTGEEVLFTHTSGRQKFRNLQQNPSMSFMVFDPTNPYFYVELRGVLAEVTPDPEGAFFVHLAERYSSPMASAPPADAAERVVLHMRVMYANRV